jgi:competence ComEA-like helix-hairpin-helix protein
VAKVNVNSATRDELVEQTGIRPEIADEIIKLREEQGKIAGLEALSEVKGIGPATLDQLRGTLAFGEEKAKEVAEKATDAAAETARSGAEIAESAADAGSRVTSIAARSGLQAVQKAADAAGEVEHATLRTSADGTAEYGRTVIDLLGEQASDNMKTAMALMQARDPGQVVEIHSRYLRTSLDRLARLTSGYVELYKKVMSSTVSTTKGQLDRAA